MKKYLFAFLIILLAGQAWGATFYVDTASTAGGDGTTTATTGANRAWATIAAVNGASFSAGDSILFNKGCTWREQLTVPSSGSAGSPITFGAYGTGVNPIINGADILTGWSAVSAATEDSGGTWHAGMEAGNTSEWTAVNDGGNFTFTASATAKNHGSYGLLYTATAAGNYGRAVYSGANVSSGSAYCRLYFYIPTGALNNSKTNAQIVKFGNTADDEYIHALLSTDGSGNITLGSYLNPYAVVSSGTTVSKDAWHCLELMYTIHASTGGGQVWLDGTSLGSVLNTNTSGVTVTTMRIGPYSSGFVANGGTLYFDDVKVDTSAIGTFPSAPANCYSKSLAADPQMLWFDGTHGASKASLDTLANNNDFYYDSGSTTLYIVSTSAPAGKTIEGAKRSYGITTNSKSYLTFQNLSLNHTKDDGGGLFATTGNNIIVDSCDISNNYFIGFYGAGDSHGYFTIRNSTFSYNGGSGIESLYSGGHVDDGHHLITSNELHHNGWRDLEKSPILMDTSNLEISYNYIHDNNALADNPSHIPHNHGIYLGHVGTTSSSINVHHNTITNQGAGSCIKVLGSADIHHNDVSNAYQGGITVGYNEGVTNTVSVYNNLSHGNHFGFFQSGNVGGTFNLSVYNNVFWNNNHTAQDAWPDEVAIIDNLASLNFKNNILGGDAAGVFAGMYLGSQSGTVSVDYNLYYTASNPFYYATVAKNWTQWKALGFDGHGLNSNPLLTATYGLGAVSPAIDAGTPVWTYAAYPGDYYGNKIYGSKPDIGAVEKKKYIFDDDDMLPKKCKSSNTDCYNAP